MNRPKFTEHSSASDTSLLRDSYKSGASDISRTPSQKSQIAAKFSLPAAPQSWGLPLTMDFPEPDDILHNPDPRRDRKNDGGGHIFTQRGFANLGCLLFLGLGLTTLFAGYPLISFFRDYKPGNQGGFNLGGINATGQIPQFARRVGPIDPDTPLSAHRRFSYTPGREEELVLVFSDEFNTPDRSFYPGDDPFWEAVDLHYWGTNDLEWYDPAGATTADGALKLTLSRADPESNHNMAYRSGMVQTWNKFCFTGGLIEAAVTLPGSSTVSGLWPAIWTMGNLGRAGFGSSLEGLWPFSYDSCDVGTLANQTYPGTREPLLAVTQGDEHNNYELSFLPGQRLSACTCQGESHPGPMKPDGSYVGRSAPEIDVFEALVHSGIGQVSLSAQWAPFNAGFNMSTEPEDYTIYSAGVELNEYHGGVFQQTTSTLALTNTDCYELGGTGCYAIYGFEYKTGFDDGYITWINDDQPAWTLWSSAMRPDPRVEIGQRTIPTEPMYIIANLGFSSNFAYISDDLVFPATMSIDYIRVYQPANARHTGCDPQDHPTAAYINAYSRAYANPNLTIWSDMEEPWPRNRLADDCT